MNEQEFNRLRELSWRRGLTPAEKAKVEEYLAVHPEGGAAWETEMGLNHLVAGMADAPVPSNFTSRILQMADQGRKRAVPPRWQTRATAWLDRVRPLLTRYGWATGVVGLVLAGGWLHQAQQKQRLEKGVVLMVESVHAGPVPSPTLLADFDAIAQLPAPPKGAPLALVSDDELFDALRPAGEFHE